jgi:hypothetical protein
MRYTAEDLLRGTAIDKAAWYPVHVKDVRESEAETDGSQNVIVDLVVEDGEFKGVPVMRYFNEKAPGFIKDYAAANGIDLDASGGVFDFEATKGAHIDAFIEQRKDNKGNLQNNVSRFRKRQQVVA